MEKFDFDEEIRKETAAAMTPIYFIFGAGVLAVLLKVILKYFLHFS